MANRFLSNIKINDAYTFPASDGSNGQVIVTDGSGNLSFASPSSSSSASVIYRDNFTGDGSTTVFYLQNSLSDEDQTNIYIDGVYQEKGTYSLSNNAITFTTPPPNGDSVEVMSISGINVGPTTIYQDNFTGDGTTTDFTLAQAVSDEVKTMVYFNGVYQFKGTYSLNGTLMSFDTAPTNGVDIEVISIASAAAADYNQKMLFYGKASEAISKGDAIMLGGQEGDHFLLAKATQAAIAANHEYFLGLASQDLAQGEFGYVTEFGKIIEIDTSGYTAGDVLWFDAGGSTAGALTTTEPAAPLAKIQVAAVIRSHPNEGVLFIRPTWYHELGELHDVNITSVADKDLLVWNDTAGYWENSKTVDTLTGNTLSATTLTGTLSTSAQTNITSVGTLSSLAVDGAISLQDTSIPSAGTARIFSRDTNSYLYIQTGSGNQIQLLDGSQNTLALFNPSLVSFSISNSERMRIDSSGNVGIGTTNPPNYGAGYVITATNGYTGGGFVTMANGVAGGRILSDGGSTAVAELRDLPLIFQTNGTSKMFIKSSGEVGIGTTSPDSKLQIANADGSSYRFGYAGTSDVYIDARTTYFRTANGGSNTVTIDASGNVGINDTSPTIAKASIVSSDSSIPTLRISNQADGGSGFVFQRWAYIRTTDAYKLDLVQEVSAGLVQYRFDLTNNSTTYTSNLVLDRGNVGIGTSSPDHKLQVNGGTTNVVAHFQSTDSIGGIKLSDSTGNVELTTSGTNGFNIHPAGGSAVFRVTGSGNVGIGDTSPHTKLHIKENVTNTVNISTTVSSHPNGAFVELENSSGFTGGGVGITAVGLGSAGRYGAITFIDETSDNNGTGGYMQFFTSAGKTDSLDERMRITSAGAVSFKDGTYEYGRIIQDTYQFIIIGNGDVGLGFLGSGIDGTRRIIPRNTNGTISNGLIDLGDGGSRFQDIFATNGTIQTSDANEKSNIQDSILGLDFVSRLTPRSYTWNTGTRTHYGLISQEIEGVLNDLNIPTQEFAGFIKSDVSERKDGSEYSYGLRYQEFIAPMIKAIQEQQEIIEDLKQRILTLENSNNG